MANEKKITHEEGGRLPHRANRAFFSSISIILPKNLHNSIIFCIFAR